MSEKRIRVTVKDLETGEEDMAEIADDYMLVCAGAVYLAHTNVHANGTHVLTVKRGKPDDKLAIMSTTESQPASDGQEE